MKKFLIAFCSIFFISNYAYSQNLAVLNKLDKNYQACLDSGKNMLQCSQKYYFQMDSFLNVAYKNYRITLPDQQKKTLKAEQLKWLSLRDNYFRKVDNQLKAEQGGRDAQMIAMDDKAQFVRERVLYFIKKLSH